MRTRSKFTTLAAAAAVAFSVAAVTAPAAKADPGDPAAQAELTAQVSCVSPPHLYNGDGAGRMLGSYNLKVAPYASCGNVTNLSRGTYIYLHCYMSNDYGNTWWYVRVAGTSTHGWMANENFQYEERDDDPNDGFYWTAPCS